MLREVARSEHGEVTGTYTELQGCDFQSTQQEKYVTHTHTRVLLVVQQQCDTYEQH